MDYKIQQLKIMAEREEAQSENEQYGAHITHWSGLAKPVNIDAEALRVLIAHYEKRLSKSEE